MEVPVDASSMNWFPAPPSAPRASAAGGQLRRLVVATSFWLTVALPLALLALLAIGLETPTHRTAFVGLVAAYPVVAALGHGYGS